VSNELRSNGPVGRNGVTPPSERSERRCTSSSVPILQHSDMGLTISHTKTQVVRSLPVLKRLFDSSSLRLVMIMLEEMPHDPLLVRLGLESESESASVEETPGERVDEGEGDGSGWAEGGEDEGEAAEDDDEGKSKVSVPAHVVSDRQWMGQ
jgi:hypothetical protein